MSYNVFFVFLMISLIGNASADYALLWHALDAVKLDTGRFQFSAVSAFYVGQALGTVLLAPLLSVFFDRMKKLQASVLIDLSYFAILILLYFVSDTVHFGFSMMLPTMIFISALSSLHRNSVCFYIIKKSGDERLTKNLIVSLTLAQLLGAALSGALYHGLGFQGCLIIACATFIPIFPLYYFIFRGDAAPLKRLTQQRSRFTQYWSELKEGIALLFSKPLLRGTLLSITVLNIAGAIFPVFVAHAYKALGITDSRAFTWTLSAGLLTGLIFVKPLEKLGKNIPVKWVLPISVTLNIVFLGFYLLQPSLVWVVAFFVSACTASTFRNLVSARFRVVLVEKQEMGRVNSAYGSVLSSGQILGGLLLLPLIEKSLQQGIYAAIALLLAASFLSVKLLNGAPRL